MSGIEVKHKLARLNNQLLFGNACKTTFWFALLRREYLSTFISSLKRTVASSQLNQYTPACLSETRMFRIT